MADKQEEKPRKRFTIEVIKQMLTLTTSAFGVVTALAWNNVIQSIVNDYIKKYFPAGGLISLFFYAIVVTILAVAVTLELSRILDRVDHNK